MNKEFAFTIIKKTKEDYNRIAPHFDVTRKLPWDEFEEFKKYIWENANILDLGCGNGRLVSFLNKITKDSPLLQRTVLCNRYVGLDISEEIIKTAKKNHPGFEFLIGDFSKLPFEDDTFDIIFSIASFHHIPSEELRLEALEEMKRVLRKDGKILMTVWNLWDQEKYQRYIKSTTDEWISNNYSSNEMRSLKSSHLAPLDSNNSEYDVGDSLIPWKSPEGKVLAERYYHAFRELELKELFKKAELKIEKISTGKFNITLITT